MFYRLAARLGFALFILTPLSARAEYRAYRIGIMDEKTKIERTVISTLDPIQYAGYYLVKRNESTRLISTWKCRARSDYFLPICAEPKKPLGGQSPAGN